uniref:Uncharacterized protein n=1 Tax=viral metagenome TaxID=1070528 RepID=A0A6C0I7J8_9ZZZZ
MFFKNIDLHKFQSSAFQFVLYFTWFLYFVIAFGLSANAPQYLTDMQYYVKIYVSLFLILRFNPFRRINFTELDGKIAFSAGMFLITTTAIDKILITYLNEIKQYLNFLRV